MSAGAFLRSKYQDNASRIYGIRVQPETLTLTVGGTANAPPAGAIDQPVTARVSQGTRSFGVTPRKIRFRFTSVTPPGYEPNGVLQIPVLTQAAYNAFIATPFLTGTYTLDGTDYDVTILGSTEEKVR